MKERISEQEARRGLAIRHYPGKWKKAQELAHDNRHHPELDYWERVRILYLELGGEYVRQLKFLQQLTYMFPFDTARKA